MNYIMNAGLIGDDITKVYHAYLKNDYYNMGNGVGDALHILLKGKSNELEQADVDVKCLLQVATNLTSTLEKVVKHFADKGPKVLVTKIKEAVLNSTVEARQCVKRQENGNVVQCLLEVAESLKPQTRVVVEDLKARNVSKAVVDGKRLVANASHGVKGCLRRAQTTVVNGVDVQCLLDAINKLVDDVQTVLNDW